MGRPSEIPLVEIDLENDLIRRRFLCGLVDNLPQDVDILIGNDLPPVLPLQTAKNRTIEHAIAETHVVLSEIADN